MSNKIKYIIIMILAPLGLLAQDAKSHIRSGNKLYKAGDFAGAEVEYKKADNENELAYISAFNKGSALFKQDRFEEAKSAFEKALSVGQTKKEKANAAYNLGNTHLAQQKPSEAVEAYKNTLKLNPSDEQARYNLSLAKQMLQQQQQQQQQNKDNKEEDNKNQQQQQQQNKDDKDKDNKNQQEQAENEQEQPKQKEEEKEEESQNEQQNQVPSRQANEISQEEAEQLLEAIKRDEQKLHEKKKKQKIGHVKTLKDW